MAALADILLAQWSGQWTGLRRLTYDYLDMLETEHLGRTLPFPTSKTLGYQFWCMLGAQESYTRKLQHGSWQGFSSSLDQFEAVTPAIIKQQMMRADEALANLLAMVDLEQPLANGQAGYDVVFQIIKHESHHHGQLINFMFFLRLPIPPSWHNEWALAYDE
jgi:hypothetical protein